MPYICAHLMNNFAHFQLGAANKNASFLRKKRQQKNPRIYLFRCENIQSGLHVPCKQKKETESNNNNNNTESANLYAYYDLKTLFIYLVFVRPLSYFHLFVSSIVLLLCCCWSPITAKQQLPMHSNWFYSKKICFLSALILMCACAYLITEKTPIPEFSKNVHVSNNWRAKPDHIHRHTAQQNKTKRNGTIVRTKLFVVVARMILLCIQCA